LEILVVPALSMFGAGRGSQVHPRRYIKDKSWRTSPPPIANHVMAAPHVARVLWRQQKELKMQISRTSKIIPPL
jgi:hypothetical protein